MHLLFVTQELGKIPSGVVTVLGQLCKGWPESDRITVLMNPTHWAGSHLRQQLQGKNQIDLQRIPAWLMSDNLNAALLRMARPVRIILRIGLIPVTLIQSLLLLVWMAFWMKRQGIDGILSHNGGWPGGMLNRWSIYAGALAGVPERVLVIHNTPLVPTGMARKAMDALSRTLSGRLATRIVTVSNACRQSLEQEAGFGRSLEVIYNGISEQPPVSGSETSGAPWGKQHPTIGFVGELHPRKGVHVLVEALAGVKAEGELVLIGNGDDEYTEELREAAAQVTHPVHFLGFRDDVQELYRWIDVLVLPSLNFESFGMVIVEAMRDGIPVICSDFGGMKEVVADQETGFVVPAGDAQALGKCLDRLLGDADLRQQMGKAGRQRMEQKFSSASMTDHYVRVFHGR